MSFLRNVAGVLATNMAAAPLAIVSSIVLARCLSVPDRGLYAVLTTFSAVVYLLGQLAWADAAIYRIRRHGVSAARTFSTGLIANLLITGAALAICLLLREAITSRILGEVPAIAFVLAALASPFLAVGDFLRGVARALDRFDLHNWYLLFQSGGLLVALAIALPMLGGGLDASLVAFLLVQVALVIGFGARVATLSGVELRFDIEEAKTSLAYGWSLYFRNLCIHLHERVDIFVLVALGTGAFDIALYAAAVSLVQPIRLLPGALGTALLPQLASLSDAEAADFIAPIARQSAFLMTLALIALVPAGLVGIPILFGNEYAGAAMPFLVLVPGMGAVTLSRVLSRYFAAVGRQRPLLVMGAAALVMNVILNLVLIPRFGILGAALASLVSYSAEAIGVAAIFLWDTRKTPRDAFMPRASDLHTFRRQLRSLRENRSG